MRSKLGSGSQFIFTMKVKQSNTDNTEEYSLNALLDQEAEEDIELLFEKGSNQSESESVDYF